MFTESNEGRHLCPSVPALKRHQQLNCKSQAISKPPSNGQENLRKTGSTIIELVDQSPWDLPLNI